MDKKELVKIINEVVEWKLKKIVPELEQKIRKELEEEIQKPKSEEAEYSLTTALQDDSEVEQEEPVERKEFRFTKNPVLNKILNETVYQRPVTPMGSRVSPDVDGDMETLHFDQSNMPIPGQRIAPAAKNSTAVLRQQLEMESGDPVLAKIMARNYKEILKKADEKAKSKRPGGGI